METVLAVAGWTALFVSCAALVVGIVFLFRARTRQVGAAVILWWITGLCASYGLITGDGALAAAAATLWCAAAASVLVAARLGDKRSSGSSGPSGNRKRPHV